MNQKINIMLLCLISMLIMLPTFELRAEKEKKSNSLIGKWIRGKDEYILFRKNGTFQKAYNHPLGNVLVEGYYTVDENKVPHQLRYKLTSVLVDGQESKLAPKPGKILKGIFQVEYHNLSIETVYNDEEPFPQEFSRPQKYKKVK